MNVKLPLCSKLKEYKVPPDLIAELGRNYKMGHADICLHLECLGKQMQKGYYGAATKTQARNLIAEFMMDNVGPP